MTTIVIDFTRMQIAADSQTTSHMCDDYHGIVGHTQHYSHSTEKVVKVKDVYIAGAKKILICGNHDLDHHTMKDLVEVYDEVYALKKYKEMWLSHAPIHPDELRGKVNVHGHTHFHVIDDDRYVNVCMEQINYTPIELHEIRAKIYKEKLIG